MHKVNQIEWKEEEEEELTNNSPKENINKHTTWHASAIP